jgi:hypothetical protein
MVEGLQRWGPEDARFKMPVGDVQARKAAHRLIEVRHAQQGEWGRRQQEATTL